MFPWRCQLWKPISPADEMQEKHTERIWRHIWILPPLSTFNLWSHTGAVKLNGVWSNCVHEEPESSMVMWFDLVSQEHFPRAGRWWGRTREIPLNLLWAIIWWIMVGSCRVPYDQSCSTRIRLSHSSAVYLSAFPCRTTPFLLRVDPTLSSVLVSFQLTFSCCSRNLFLNDWCSV